MSFSKISKLIKRQIKLYREDIPIQIEAKRTKPEDIFTARFDGERLIVVIEEIQIEAKLFGWSIEETIEIVLAHELGHVADPNFNERQKLMDMLYKEFELMFVPIQARLEILNSNDLESSREFVKEQLALQFSGERLKIFQDEVIQAKPFTAEDILQLEKSETIIKELEKINNELEMNAWRYGRDYVSQQLSMQYENFNKHNIQCHHNYRKIQYDNFKQYVKQVRQLI